MKGEHPESLDSLRARPHWSFSRINGLVNFCSLAWAFRYVYDVEPLHTPAAPVFGGAFHRALSFHAARRMAGGEASAAETRDLFAELLSESLESTEPPVRFARSETPGSLIEKGAAMIAAYLDSIDPDERVTGVGVPFSVPLFDASGERLDRPLIGEFDLTVQRDGVVTIVDWKTSARRWPDAKARTDLQPACYLYAHYAGTGDVTARFRFDVVTRTATSACEQYPARRDFEDFARLGELVRVLERIVANECFLPADASWQCRNCPYSLACQSWHRDRARSVVHIGAAA